MSKPQNFIKWYSYCKSKRRDLGSMSVLLLTLSTFFMGFFGFWITIGKIIRVPGALFLILWIVFTIIANHNRIKRWFVEKFLLLKKR